MKFKYTSYLLIFSCFCLATAKEHDSLQLESLYKKYFELPRDDVHIYFNKGVYLKGDKIWFTAYIKERNGLPSLNSTTQYCLLYNVTGNPLSQKVLHVSKGNTPGQLKVEPEYTTGILYIMAFTNWMRNFDKEDVFKGKLILKGVESNVVELSYGQNAHQVTIHAEGGKFITQTVNNFAFRITNYNNSSVKVKDAFVMDSMGHMVSSNIAVNSSGMGKFNIRPKSRELYFFKAEMENRGIIENQLPNVENEGVIISINNLIEDRILIEFSSNSSNFPKLKNKKFHLTINQGGQMIRKSFTYVKVGFSVEFMRKDLMRGVNIVTLFNHDYNPIVKRLVFYSIENYHITKTKLVKAAKRNDSINLQLQLLANKSINSRISISVLQENTVANFNEKSIISSFLLSPFIRGEIDDIDFYLSSVNRKKKFELDLLMLLQKVKSPIDNDFIFNPLQKQFEYSKGGTLKGKVYNANYNCDEKILMYPTSFENRTFTKVDNNKDFVFDNILVYKGDSIKLLLLNEKGKLIKPEVSFEFSPFKEYTEPFPTTDILNDAECVLQRQFVIRFNDPLIFENQTELEEVSVFGQRHRDNLNHRSVLTGGLFAGVKITKKEIEENVVLSKLLRKLGYNVSAGPINGNILVKAKLPMSKPPVVVLNGFPMREGLRDFPLESIDEIYYEHMGTHGSNGGTIYIYQKSGSFSRKNDEDQFINLYTEEGFDRGETYYAPNYSSYSDEGFLNYGAIYWNGNIKTDNKDIFEITFPDYRNDRVKLFLEGMNTNGGLIYDSITVDVK